MILPVPIHIPVAQAFARQVVLTVAELPELKKDKITTSSLQQGSRHGSLEVETAPWSLTERESPQNMVQG